MANALVLFATGSEELETVSIVNILRRGGVAVTLAGLNSGTLTGARGITLLPDTDLDQALQQNFDILVLPGGLPGVDHLKADDRVIKLAQSMVQQGKYIAAICAAPSILAESGLLNGLVATCYPSCLNDYPAIQVSSKPHEETGKIITSRGPGTAMDFALLLVERLQGAETRQQVEAALVR